LAGNINERTVKPGPRSDAPDRTALMTRHAAAKARRDAAVLGSPEFTAAAEEVGRIEIAIAAIEEPPPTAPQTPQ
jgi:hypothetical protein